MAKLVVHLASGPVTHEFSAAEVTVGRIAGNTVQIADSSVSAHHARFVLQNGCYRLRDLGSTNSTWIDQEPVSVAILPGDCTIRFGTVKAEFFAETPAAADPAQLAEAQTKIADLTEQRAEFQKKHEAVSAERDRTRRELEELGRKLAEQEKAHGTLLEERNSAQKRSEEIAAELQKAEGVAAALRNEQADAAKKLSEDLKNAREQITALTSERDQLAEKISAAAAQAGQFEAVQADERRVTDERIAVLEQERAALAEAQNALRAKLSDALSTTASIEAAQAEKQQLAALLQESHHRIAALTHEQSAAAAHIASLESERAAHTNTASELQAAHQQIAALIEERGNAHGSLAAELEQSRQALSAALSRHEAAASQSSAQLADLQGQISGLRAERNAAIERAEKSLREGEETRRQLAAQADEVERSHRQHQQAQGEIAAITAELHRLREQREAALREGEELRNQLAAREQANLALAVERDALAKGTHELSSKTTDYDAQLQTLAEAHEKAKLELTQLREKLEGNTREALIFKGQRDAADTAREQIASRTTGLEREVEQLRKERDALKGQHFTLATERDALKTEVASLIEERKVNRDLLSKLAEAEQQMELFQAQQRAVASELEQARLAEQELNSILAESPRLVNWLHGGVQKQTAEKSKSPPEDHKIVSIDGGIRPMREAIEKMRAALELSQTSPAEGLRELGIQLGSVNLRTESSPSRRTMHRLGSTLGLLIGELRTAPRATRPTAFQTIRDGIDLLERLLEENNPALPSASAVVVDRDSRSLQAVITAMKSIGFKLFCAEDARPALQTLASEDHDLILLDWQTSLTPQTTQQIRAMPRHLSTPIILLAAAENETAARLGGDEVLVKPLTAPEVSLKALISVLRHQLDQAGLRREPVFTVQ